MVKLTEENIAKDGEDRVNTLGENIKASRESRQLTQEELARKMRMGTKKIEDYESGKQIPSNQTLLKLSTVLDIPASVLLNSAAEARAHLHV